MDGGGKKAFLVESDLQELGVLVSSADTYESVSFSSRRDGLAGHFSRNVRLRWRSIVEGEGEISKDIWSYLSARFILELGNRQG